MAGRLSTDPHLERAAETVRAAYRAAGREEPDVVTAPSPLRALEILPGEVTARSDDGTVREFVDAARQTGERLCECPVCQGAGNTWARLRDDHGQDDPCWCALCVGAEPRWGPAAHPVLFRAAGWAEVTASRDAGHWRPSDEAETRALGRDAGWWYLGGRVAVLSALPVVFRLDERGLLHAADGPAAVYRDGWEVHARHGVAVPAGHADRSLTPNEILGVANAETRRELIDEYGSDRFIRDRGGRLVHSDGTGQLWEVPASVHDRPGHGPMTRIVRVVDATCDADGRRRVYWLQVPPWVEEARQAVAWTFRMTAEQYRPSLET